MKSPDQFLRSRVYNLSPRDMDAVIDLISEIVDERTKEVHSLEERLKIENPELLDDIMDDVRPHNFWRHNFLWESCVWRLQGIFEGILDERFLRNARKYRGLRDRLTALKNAGFSIKNENELIKWADLRNELSHSPPKQIDGHGAYLDKNDLLEFREFLVNILRDLEKQKQA